MSNSTPIRSNKKVVGKKRRRHRAREFPFRIGCWLVRPKLGKTERRSTLLSIVFWANAWTAIAQPSSSSFRVIAFFDGERDLAHHSFVLEANRWFLALAKKDHFTYDTNSNWTNLNSTFLKSYQVVIFLDARPDSQSQRVAFRDFVEHGGSWMGFHFAGFALTPSAFPQDWDWYHNEFLGSGSYVSNTWRPTSAILHVEDRTHPVTKNLPAFFASAPNEWYRWSNDLRKNPDIDILLAIDSSSFPLGTGPKPNEIWHAGYYPVVWTNRRYKMIYFNMGHNDMDYETKSNRTLSSTFGNVYQNSLFENALLWLGGASKK